MPRLEGGQFRRNTLAHLYDERGAADPERARIGERRGSQDGFTGRGAAWPVGVRGSEPADRIVVDSDAAADRRVDVADAGTSERRGDRHDEVASTGHLDGCRGDVRPDQARDHKQ